MELLKEIPEQVQYLITNEAGASVYSASKLATEEFPNFDVATIQAPLYCKAGAGSSGRTGENRSQVHRRGTVSA